MKKEISATGQGVERHGSNNYFAMLGLLVLVFATWQDDWDWPYWWAAVVIIQMCLLIVLPLVLWASAVRFKSLLKGLIHDCELANNIDDLQAEHVSAKRLHQLLASLTHGCFSPLERQPVLGALLAVIGSSGFVVLLQTLQQLGLNR